MADPHFVAVDWGTSGFRLWVMCKDGTVLAATSAPLGMSHLKRNDFNHVLKKASTLSALRKMCPPSSAAWRAQHKAGAKLPICVP